MCAGARLYDVWNGEGGSTKTELITGNQPYGSQWVIITEIILDKVEGCVTQIYKPPGLHCILKQQEGKVK